jgi:hypothetical protein
MIMADVKTEPLVWVKDNAGNRFLCPLNSLMDPNSVSEEQKSQCVDDAAELKKVPGDEKLQFGKSESPS